MHKEKRDELWYCCECGCGANSALVSEYCPSCQKHRCTLCAMEELPASKRVSTPAAAPSPKSSKEQRHKKKKGATKTKNTPNDTATICMNAKSQSPCVGEAQQRVGRRSLSGTPPSTSASLPGSTRASPSPTRASPSHTRASPSHTRASPSHTRASSQIGNLANQGSPGSIPTSDHLSVSPNGVLESSASANSLSTEAPHAAPVAGPMTGFYESTSLPAQPEALRFNLHPQPFEPHPLEYNYELLPLLSRTTTVETPRNTSPPFSLDSCQDTPIPQSTPPDFYYPLYPNGNNLTRIPSPSEAFNPDFEPDSYSYDPRFPSDEIGLHETFQTMTRSCNGGYPNVSQSQPLPENPATHPSIQAVDKLALVKQPKAETGVPSKSSDRRSLPSPPKKRKLEHTTLGHKGRRYYGFPSDDGAANYEEKSLACPFYKMNPKQYMGCGERSIGNISALGQHIRQSHKSKPHSCTDCFQPFDSDASLRLHRESGPCYVTGGCAVGDLEQVPRKCKGRKETWYWYWEQLFPYLTPPPSPFTDGFDVVGQFALSAIQNVISQCAVKEPLKSELIHSMLTASDNWRKHPSAFLDYSQLSNHMRPDLTANRDYGLQH